MDSLDLFNNIAGSALMGFRIGTEYDNNREQARQGAFNRDMMAKEDARQELLTNDTLTNSTQNRILAQSQERRAVETQKDSLLTSDVNRKGVLQDIAASQAATKLAQQQEARLKETSDLNLNILRQQQDDLMQGRNVKAFDRLLEMHGGDYAKTIADPIAQQAVFGMLMTDETFGKAVNSHGKAVGMAQTKDGFVIMVQGKDGVPRPLTQDGKTGSLPFVITPQAVEAQLASVAARLDIQTNGQLRASIEGALGPVQGGQMAAAMHSADPAVAATAVPQAKPNLAAASAAATKDSVAAATPAKPAATVGENGVPTLLAAPKTAAKPVDVLAANPAPISPVSPQVSDAINGVSATRRTVADALTTSKTAQEFEQKKIDFSAEQQFAAENADARAGVRNTPPADWTATRKKVGEALLTASNPVSALKHATGETTIGGALGATAAVAYKAGKKAVDLEVAAVKSVSDAVRKVGSDAAKSFAASFSKNTGAPAPSPEDAAHTTTEFANASKTVVAFGADLDAAKKSATKAPVPVKEMATPAGMAQTYNAVGQAIQAETPVQRVANDLTAIDALTSRTRTVDRAMATARLVKGGYLPAEAFTNMLQSGRLNFEDIKAAAGETGARAELIRAQFQRDQLRESVGLEKQKQYEAAYDKNLKTAVQPALAEIVNENPKLIEKLVGGTGSGKFKTPATGVKAEQLVYGLIDGFLRNPETAQTIIPGWQGGPPELLSPDQLRQAALVVAEYMRESSTGSGGSTGNFFMSGSDNRLIADSRSFNEWMVKKARSAKGE